MRHRGQLHLRSSLTGHYINIQLLRFFCNLLLVRCLHDVYQMNTYVGGKLEGSLTVRLPHEIMWNANLMQQGNFIDIVVLTDPIQPKNMGR